MARGVKPAVVATTHRAPDCWSCQHFAISWDPRMPYSCRAMGFKSKMLPCLEVIGADGRACLGFVRKALDTNL